MFLPRTPPRAGRLLPVRRRPPRAGGLRPFPRRRRTPAHALADLAGAAARGAGAGGGLRRSGAALPPVRAVAGPRAPAHARREGPPARAGALSRPAARGDRKSVV